MKLSLAVYQTLIGAACLFAAERGYAQGNASEIVKRSFVGNAFFLGFAPKTNAWLSIEVSSDLKKWATLACVATTNGVTEYVEEDGARASFQFYRLREAGRSVDEAEARWLQQVSGDYRCHLQHVRSPLSPSVVDADVEVRAGRKEVTNVLVNGEPLTQPSDPSDFPTIPELFERLREAQQTGCWRVAVMYDGAQAFPSWCVIEQLAGRFSTKQIDGYRISQVIFNGLD